MDVIDEASVISAVDVISADLVARGVTCAIDPDLQHSRESGLPEGSVLTVQPCLHGLVNNAGVGSMMPLELQTVESLRSVLDVNVVGAVMVTQYFLPLLRASTVDSRLGEGGKSGQARVLFMGSLAGVTVPPLMGAYSASKFALDATAAAFRQELAPQHIAVSLLEVGTIRTGIQDKTVEGMQRALEGVDAISAARYPRAVEVAAGSNRQRADAVAGNGSDVRVLVDTVASALFTAAPLPRYRVGHGRGIPGNVIWFLQTLLPDLVYDGVKRNAARPSPPPLSPAGDPVSGSALDTSRGRNTVFAGVLAVLALVLTWQNAKTAWGMPASMSSWLRRTTATDVLLAAAAVASLEMALRCPLLLLSWSW
jgi:NAD(P)-dependent dehydrogenase (short-subunit alcohol dehydrogenase family)